MPLLRDLLRRHREQRGLSQEELAALVEPPLSPDTISNLERGRTRPHRHTLEALCIALGLDEAGQREVWVAWRVSGAAMASVQGEAPRHNLPASFTSFVGREHELADVQVRLAEARLLTLTGVGGCGKTRLALEVARSALDRYVDGVWLVELAALADPDLVPHNVAGVVGGRGRAVQSTVSALAAHLRGRCQLLVLDNCEHLLDACARLVYALLRACSSLNVLATSREPLGLTGEVAWRVPSLPVLDPRHLPPLPEFQQNAAVQLFVDRAVAVQPQFVLTERNAPAVAQICQRLEGIPLALELGAARMEALTAEQLAGRLDQRFRLLTGGSRVTLPRQQTLRATLDWSYDLLSKSERRLFNQLWVFAGGWTLEAAEAICAGEGIAPEDVLDLQSQLVRKSLVVAQEESEGAKRYRLLETLRQYAQERLTVIGDLEALRQKHARYYLNFTAGLYPDRAAQVRWFRWPKPAAGQLDQLEREQDNVRTALHYLIDSGEPGQAHELVEALWQLGDIRGSLTEAQAWLIELLSVPAVADRPAVRERILPLLGEIASRHGDYATARTAFNEALAAYKSTGDQISMAHALCALAKVHFDQGSYVAAKAYLDESLSYAADVKYHGKNNWWYIGGGIALHEGRFDDARLLFQEALAVAQPGTQFAGYCQKDLAWVALEQGAYTDARASLELALQTAEELSDRNLSAYSMEGFSSLAAALGQHVRALCLGGAAAALREVRGSQLPPTWKRMLHRWLDISSAALTEAAAAAAWKRGHAMSLEEAIRYARSPVEEIARTSSARAAAREPLTRREQEVAALVAEGLTNAQIAERLVITRRTVAAHVEHILNKLGFASRHQVVAWAADRSLPN